MFKRFLNRNNIDWSRKTNNEKYLALKNALDTMNFEKFTKLVENGLDITSTEDYSHQNILIYFIQNFEKINIDPLQFIEYCLSQGININHSGNKRTQQMSPLHYAVIKKSRSILEILVIKNAEIEIRDKNGNTPLWKAVMNYRGEEEAEEIIKYLLREGASLDSENFHGISPRNLIETISGGIKNGHNNPKWNLEHLLTEN